MSGLRLRKTDGKQKEGASTHKSSSWLTLVTKPFMSHPLLQKFGMVLVGSVICLVATILLIGAFAPTLFFQLGQGSPVPGFLLWAITGHQMPPYLFPDGWSEAEMPTWIKTGDLVVSTGIKSGTHWMLYCTHQIRMRGKGDWYDSSTDTPWIDIRHKPGQTWAELKNKMNSTVLKDGTRLKDRWDSPSYPFRIFKSHYAPKLGNEGVLPVRETPHIKYLAMARNGLDVFSSLKSFWGAHTDKFKNMWGAFPPNESPEATFDSLLPGGFMYEHYFPYLRGWWSIRKEPNVLLLHYADAKKDLPGTVRQLAHFLEVNLSESEVQEVSDKCSFKHMKSLDSRMKFMLWGHDESFVIKEGGTLRHGRNGDGLSAVTPEMKQRWEDAVQAELPDHELRRWAGEGGAL